MIKPSIEEIQDYFFQQTQDLETSKDDAHHFFDYYESCGWMVGSKKMRAWKPAINNWIRNKKRFSNNGQNNKNTRTPDDFTNLW